MSSYVVSVLGPLEDTPSLETPAATALRSILDDAGVKSAHRALIKSYDNDSSKKVLYGVTVRLLNLISATYCKHCLRGGDVVIFACRSSNRLPGDYLALDAIPDVYGYGGTYSDLLVACKSPNYRSAQRWSVILAGGTLKRRNDAVDLVQRLKSHLKGLKRYRPDLFTVCGFTLHSGNIRLAALNPDGKIESDPLPMVQLKPWVAHVVQVYSSLSRRDAGMRYCPEQMRFCRWDVRKAGHGFAVTPFHVGHAPGRTTFACFEVGRLPDAETDSSPAVITELDKAYDTGIVEGFWKMSWQRATTRATEAELLMNLHENGWVPGLVRPYPETSMRDGSADLHPSGDEDVGRAKEILHLGSVGQPLSQCTTVEELLDTMYDLLEIHAHVCDLGVIHRDVSYFNALCKPKHHITTHPVSNESRVLERPCIKKIFGDANGEPCALLADLDHATTFDEFAKEPPEDAEIVGTPMFMSVYLGAPDAPRKFLNQNLRFLFGDLTAAEGTHPDLFRRAFPHGDGGFVEKFKCVMVDEEVRDPGLRSVPIPRARHDWRHDAESIYWVFLHAFSRARPLNADPDKPGTALYDLFCRAMLWSSSPSVRGRPCRESWIMPAQFHGDLFAPELGPVELLFERMASYLYIPWHLYCGEGQPMAGLRAHVHVAFRRLILWFKLDPENAEVLRVALDTSAPRYTSIFDGSLYDFAMPADEEADTGASESDSSDGMAPPSSDTRAPCGQKRKAETEAAAVTGEDDRASKKPRTSTEGASKQRDGVTAGLNFDEAARDVPNRTNVTIVADANMIPPSADADVPRAPQADESVNQRKERVSQPEERYDPALHRDSLSAKALRLMFLKDKELWFGRGKYVDP